MRGDGGRSGGGNTSRLPLISLECVEHTLPACECPSVCASARVCVGCASCVLRPGPRDGSCRAYATTR